MKFSIWMFVAVVVGGLVFADAFLPRRDISDNDRFRMWLLRQSDKEGAGEYSILVRPPRFNYYIFFN